MNTVIRFIESRKVCVTLCLAMTVYLLLQAPEVQAQDKVWQSVTTKKKQVQQKAQAQQQRAKGQVLRWKEWGTDSSYRQAIYICGRLHTNGWSGQLHYHFNRQSDKESYVKLQVAELRHEKEARQQRKDTAYRSIAGYKPYIYGKQYKVYTAQLGYGREWTVVPSVLQGNISLKATIEAGVSMALLKPVYLYLLRYDATQQPYASSEAYMVGNEELFLNRNRILGADRWSKGLSELRCIPGIYISPSIVFSPDRPSGFVQQFQIGAQLAFYTRSIPVLLQQRDTPWQASCFVGISFGKRW